MKTDKPSSDDLINGGERLELPTRDGGSMEVFVRQVTPSELVNYLRAEAAGEETVLAMTCSAGDGSNPVDLDELTLESYDALIEADRRQNFTAARGKEKRESARAARQMAALREADPELYKQMQGKQAKLMESVLSSLEPLPSESAPGSTSPGHSQ